MKAIDIAIIPPGNILELAIKINKILGVKSLRLAKDDYLPHITLLFGGVENDDQLELVHKKLAKILEGFSPLELEITRFNMEGNFDLSISNTPELYKLHTTLVREISSLLTYPVSEENFYNPESIEIDPRVKSWVNDFMQNSALENYYPHITIGGKNDLSDKQKSKYTLPIKFTAKNIGIYQLGNWCSCRKELKMLQII